LFPSIEGGQTVGVVGSIGGALAKHVGPEVTGTMIRTILEKAIDGLGPLPGAATSAEAAVRKAGGDTDVAIDDLISSHVRLAGAQGFVTNIGGLITMAVTAPANLVLICLLDPDARKALTKDAKSDMSPATVVKGEQGQKVRQLVGRAVALSLLTGVGGKRVAAFVARRIPVLGGAVGGAGDAWATRRVGRETAKMPRPPRGSAVARPIIIDAAASGELPSGA